MFFRGRVHRAEIIKIWLWIMIWNVFVVFTLTPCLCCWRGAAHIFPVYFNENRSRRTPREWKSSHREQKPRPTATPKRCFSRFPCAAISSAAADLYAILRGKYGARAVASYIFHTDAVTKWCALFNLVLLREKFNNFWVAKHLSNG